MRVFFGNGSGGFPTLDSFNVANNAVSLAVEDFNLDGAPDIVSAGTDDLISVLINNGSGSFSRQDLPGGGISLTTGVWVVGTGDFNGDTFPDVAIANGATARVSVRLGTGAGGFGGRIEYPTNGGISLDVADVTDDGVLDIAATLNLWLSILVGDGLGAFAPPSVTTFPTAAQAVRIAKLDGDDLNDITITNRTLGVVYIMRGLPQDEVMYASPAGDFSTLVKNADDTFTRTFKDGTRFEFDEDGFQTAIVDRNGNTTRYLYDAQDNLTKVIDPTNDIADPACSTQGVTCLAYTGGKLSSVTDPAGRITQFQIDGNGDLTQITDPDLSFRQFAYDARHRLTTQTSKRNFPTDYIYNFAGRNVQIDRPDNSQVFIAPSEIVGLIDTSSGEGTQANPAPVVRPEDVVGTFTDGNGNTTIFGLDIFGGATSVEDALMRVTLTGRDVDSKVSQITTPNGVATELTYDMRGNALTITEAVGDQLERVTTFTYDMAFSQIASITDPNGNPPKLFDYDSNGNLIEITDAMGMRSTFAYEEPNCLGLATTTTRAVGLPEENVTNLSYDPTTCNLDQVTDGAGNSMLFTLDTAGNAIEVTDAKLRTTRLSYDALNRITKRIDRTNGEPAPICGVAGVTCYAYDAAGNLDALTDANGSVTSFAYDERDRIVTRTDPLLIEDNFQYDGNGNLRFRTDGEGLVTEFQYDSGNRLVKQIFEPGSPNEVIRDIEYDLVDNILTIDDPDSSLTFTYDLLNRVTTTSTAGSPLQPAVVLDATYDANDNRLTVTDPTGQSDFSYDSLNRMTDMLASISQPISIHYDALNRVVMRTVPNGIVTTLSYDGASRLTDIDHELLPATLSSYSYGYDSVDNRMQVTQTRTAVAVQSPLMYVYDDLDELTQANRQISGPNETFTYDPVGNRLRRDGEAVDALYDAVNRLIEDSNFCYVYNDNGSLKAKTAKVAGACTGGVTAYSYDAENRLVRIDFPGGGFAEYRFDGLGRRIQKNVDGTITRYVYDGANILLEYDASNNLVARYTHGPGIDNPIIMERDLDSSGVFEESETFAYHADGLGSITELTDSTGSVVRAYVYGAFGGIASQTGSLVNPFTFTGREFDPESGLYFYRARYYDSDIGRFLAKDPIGFSANDVNLYRYVFNNPIRLTDPHGLQAVSGPQTPIPGTTAGQGSLLDQLKIPELPPYPDPDRSSPTCFSDCMDQRLGACPYAVLGVCPAACAYGGWTGVGAVICGAACTCLVGGICYLDRDTECAKECGVETIY